MLKVTTKIVQTDMLINVIGIISTHNKKMF